MCCFCFFFNDTATTEIYTRSIVGSVRCVQETGHMESKRRKSQPRIWTDEEDDALKQIVIEFEGSSWRERASILASRIGFTKTLKQCRERYRNYLRPNLDHNG
eukprot:TRINITY_DN29185_c0_g1_i2.p1 TRINITY_DN29185_c0_g1~~TRINITY_DN29185_c0_g1_i2.p1  ORF type:complete len:103 (-),score=22.24 TRINITY_DN29185_c0_g1_i2:153-461(-)